VTEQARPVVPELPTALADPRPVMAVGTALWTGYTVVVAVRAVLAGDGPGTGVATGAVGVALGGIGYGIFYWQRRIVRRGAGRGQHGIS
jgi:hypothetical protein